MQTVRSHGDEPPHFAVLGEPLAVELVNTRVMRDAGVEDLLGEDAAAAAWLHLHAGALPAGAAASPPGAARLRHLRDDVAELFAAALESRAPAPAAVARVNAAAAAAPLWPELTWNAGSPPGAALAADARRGPAVTLAAIARSAIEVVADPRGHRLRHCAAPGCILVFVAANPRRRWCSAESCGNRVRVARHYERARRAPRTG